MLYKAKGRPLIEAGSKGEAKRILGADEVTEFRKPSKKAFMMWCWLRLGRSDAKLLKAMLSADRAPFMAEYWADPSVVGRELKAAGIVLSDWAMIGERGYDETRHSELFYMKRGKA